MTIFLLLALSILLFCVLDDDQWIGVVMMIAWVIVCLICSCEYRGALIGYKNIDAKIAVIQKNSDAIAEKINAIELKNITSISLGDSPYKATIETYTKMIELLTEKEGAKIEYQKSIEFAESGFFRYTNKLFVNKKRFIVKD